LNNFFLRIINSKYTMPCSHCKQVGHTFKTCPTMSNEDKQKKIQDNINRRQQELQRRNERQVRIQELERQRVIREEQKKLQDKKNKKYTIHNDNDYEIALYWSDNDEDPDNLKHFTYIESRAKKFIKIDPTQNFRIIIYPTLDVLIPNSTNAIKSINLKEEKYKNIHKLFDIYIKDYENNIISQSRSMLDSIRTDNSSVINYYQQSNLGINPLNYYNHYQIEEPDRLFYIKYKIVKPKTELEKWKECGLKSNFLLQQLIKIGGKKYDNLEPLLDMVEDINIPEHSEFDKETAGIPSHLTNVT
jgi:hypothetical protein